MMKKPLFAIAALAVSMTAVSAPMTAQAAVLEPIKSGNGYVIYAGQGTECLQQTLEQIFTDLESNGFYCPELPGVQEPDAGVPEQPDIQEPDAEAPEQPDTQQPGSGTQQPDNQQPGSGTQQPDSQQPGSGTPEQPDTQQPDMEAPGEDEVHPYAAQILNLVNEERAKAGLSSVKLDTNITAAANVRAVEIKESFSHTRPDGSSFSTALKEQGVSYRGSGENIAWGQKSPEQVMNAWMNSDGHRANILNQNFKNIGVGYYQDANGVNYWVQLFTY